MKVLVAIKEVAEAEEGFEIDGLDVAAEYLEYDLNEWDEYALEEAVRLSDDRPDVEVVTVTVGPERVEETIRQALAKGADRAVRVWDDALADAGLLDMTTKTRLLAAVVADEEPDLAFAGVQAADDGFGATGVSLADAVGYEWAAVVNDFSLDAEAGVATVRRELEGRVREVTEVDLPAVFTVQTGINEPRYASLGGIRAAQRAEIAVCDLDDLGIDPGAVVGRVRLTDMYEPERETEAALFEGRPDETAARLAEVLREKGVGAE